MSLRLMRRRAASTLLAITAMVGAMVGGLIGTVHPAAAASPTCPCTVFAPTATPGTVDSGDGNSVNLGLRFYSDTDGWIDGVRFYKAADNLGTHVGSLWTADGSLLAQATFSNESASGWQQVNFSTPVHITAQTNYIVSYFAPQGNYSDDPGYFATTGVDNSPLHAPADTSSDPNGVFAYSPAPAFPGNTFNGTNYWVDAVFDTNAPTGPSSPPANAVTTTLFSSSTTPGVVDAGDASSVDLGVTFYSDKDGWISGLRFYKSAANEGTHVGSLWTASGALLAQANFANETASGWQQVTFPTPVPIVAGTMYVASYFAPDGHYSADAGFFSTSGADNPPLHAPASSAATPNGVFVYSPVPAFPGSTFNSNNYWVDPVLLTAPAVTVPTLSSLAVTAGSTSLAKGGSEALTVTGTYSDGTTRDVTGQATWKSSNPAAATVNASGTVTAVAPGSTTITASIGGVSGTIGITVTAPVVAIIVTGNPLVAVGGTTSMTATAILSNGTLANVTNSATWSIAKAATATVNNKGLVTGVAPGLTVVTANVGSVKGIWPIAVIARTLKSIRISPAAPSLAVRSAQTVWVTGTWSDGSTGPVTLPTLWLSSNPSVASVGPLLSNGTAQVTARAPGTAQITAISGFMVTTTTVTVHR